MLHQLCTQHHRYLSPLRDSPRRVVLVLEWLVCLRAECGHHGVHHLLGSKLISSRWLNYGIPSVHTRKYTNAHMQWSHRRANACSASARRVAAGVGGVGAAPAKLSIRWQLTVYDGTYLADSSALHELSDLLAQQQVFRAERGWWVVEHVVEQGGSYGVINDGC